MWSSDLPSYKNLTAPAKPTDRSFAELVKLVGDHYSPIPSVIVECFCFNTHIRQPGESVATFIAELRHLTRYCEFGDSLKDMLRNRLVCGIDNGPMQRILLAEPALNLDKAVEIHSSSYGIRGAECKRFAKVSASTSCKCPQESLSYDSSSSKDMNS